MKKRFLAILITVLLFSIGLAACGSNDATTEQPAADNGDGEAVQGEVDTRGVTISFWMQRYGQNPAVQDAWMDDVVARFYEQTGITVEVTVIDWGQALTRYTLASTGGEAPDVADTFFIQSMVQMGGGEFGPMQINDLAAEIGMYNYFDSIIHEVQVGEDFYGIPWRADVRAMAYNTDFFEEAGITTLPETWEEWVEIGQALTITDANGNIERAGLLWSNGTARFDQTWYTVLAQAGGTILNEDYTEIRFDSPEGIASLQFMQDIVYVYGLSPDTVIDPSFEASMEFLAGNSAMLASTAADFMLQLEANAPHMRDSVAAAVMPSRDGTGPSSVAFAAPIAIFRTTEHPEAAKEWVRFFTSEEIQLEASITLSLLNANINVMNDPHFRDDPWLSVFAQQFERSQMGDLPIATWSQMTAWPDGPFAQMTTEIMAGQDVQEAVNRAISVVEELLE